RRLLFVIWPIDASTRKEYSRPSSPLLIVCLITSSFRSWLLSLCRYLQVPEYFGTTPAALLSLEYL
ncbi:hypothetical protein JMJ77_0009145, partial [Colletotrichum scovillei]